MKRSRRFISIVAAAAPMAALTLTLTACPKPPPPPPPTPTPTPVAGTWCKPDGINPRPALTVAIEVAYDPANNKAKIVNAADPHKTIQICRQDTVLWVADSEGDFEDPQFVGGQSPFDKPFKRAKRQMKSDNPKKDAKGKYPYDLRFKADKKPTCTVDPRIEVMD